AAAGRHQHGGVPVLHGPHHSGLGRWDDPRAGGGADRGGPVALALARRYRLRPLDRIHALSATLLIRSGRPFMYKHRVGIVAGAAALAAAIASATVYAQDVSDEPLVMPSAEELLAQRDPGEEITARRIAMATIGVYSDKTLYMI